MPLQSIEGSSAAVRSQDVVIVGAGLAGVRTAGALRALGHDGSVLLINGEEHLPYDRPPLSKQVLTGAWAPDKTALRIDDLAVEWRHATTATALDLEARSLLLSSGERLPFDGLVIACGATPRKLPWCGFAGVHLVRTLDDAISLRSELEATPGHVLVVGAGFIGAEVASSVRSLGIPVTVVEPAETPMQLALGRDVGNAFAGLMRDHGVDLRASTSVTDWKGDSTGRIRAVTLSDGTILDVDLVVVAIGVVPDLDWLRGSGLDCTDGVLCGAGGVAAPGVVAVGDVARWPNVRLGTHRRVEHWDMAAKQAGVAARTLLGATPTADAAVDPTAIPWFWSDQFGCKVQMYGTTFAHDEVVLHDVPSGNGLLALYRRGTELTAALGVNRTRDLLRFRRLLESGPVSWVDALAAAA